MKRREWAYLLAVLAGEVAGIALIAIGAGLIFLPAGLIVAGVGLVLLSVSASMGGG